MEKNKLEKICTFAGECSISNYGDFPICRGDYIDCIHYVNTIARKLEEYNKND